MDGFAIHSSATMLASHLRPVLLELTGNLEAGADWPDRIRVDQALRISTGAAIPGDCDAVVPVEQADERAGTIQVRAPVLPGTHVRPRGEDIQTGASAVTKGTLLRPQEIALLAALGIESIAVIPSPTVSVVSIGPELLPAARPFPVNDTNGPMLAAQVSTSNATVLRVEQCDGNLKELAHMIDHLALDSDLILTSGGISNSAADSMTEVLAANPDAELWNVRLRPGKHFGARYLDGRTILSLPGNPVAALVGFELFGRLAIDLLAGRHIERLTRSARSAEPMAGTLGYTDALRGRAWTDESGQLIVKPNERRGSGIVSSLPAANCLIMLPETTDSVLQGETVEIRWVGYQ